MRLCVIGSGYVGLVTGACLADSGNHVVAVDNDADKVRRLADGDPIIFEPGLEELLKANLAAGRLQFTTQARQGVARSRVVFLAVGTPPQADGSADLSNIESAAADVAKALSGFTVIVVKSTVPVGTCDRLERLIGRQAGHSFQVVSNPEFLKEGTAVDDFLRPDRVIIGTEDTEAGEIVAALYTPFVRNNKPIMIMSRRASEMSKYASNAYLATRISFINEMAEICERVGIDIDEVRRGLGADARIGHHFLYPGVGYGGSCFPKDVQALANFGREAGVGCEILEAVHRRNEAQRAQIVHKILDRLGPSLAGRKVALWGLAFKPKTDDIREAPAMTIIAELLKAGARLAVHDPQALDNVRAVFGDRISYHTDAYETLADAEALVTVTEWMEYRSPDFERIRADLKQPLIFDGRNIYDPKIMARYNFEYYSVGRPALRPATSDANPT
ncbi:MAG: UDP-glucose dehydrogenase family protein [Phycisphaerae bacterium]